MKLSKRTYYTLMFLFALVVVLLCYPSAVLGCYPAGPDNWYDVRLEFDESTIPEGATIAYENPDSWSTVRYAVRNDAAEPLYFVSTVSKLGGTRPSESEIPRDLWPHAKLVSGKAYRYDVVGEGNWELGRRIMSYINESHYIIGDNALENSLEERGLEFYNILEDGRPEDVTVPDPQHFALDVYYMKELSNITGTVYYELNDDYDSIRYQRGVESCTGLESQFFWEFLVSTPFGWGLGAILFFVIAVVIRRIFGKGKGRIEFNRQFYLKLFLISLGCAIAIFLCTFVSTLWSPPLFEFFPIFAPVMLILVVLACYFLFMFVRLKPKG